MKAPYLAAVVQMASGEDVEQNLQTAARLIEQAAHAGARFVALPELFDCLGRMDTMVARAEPIPGRISQLLGEWARRWRITLLGGSISERAVVDGQSRVFNTSLLLGPEGEQLACYRKMHLFDMQRPSVVYQESRYFAAGQQPTCTETALGTVGQSICFDLRFPELYREYAARQADLLCVPSAFALATGRDHWEVLLRARAIENQAYVIAPNQCGEHTPEFTSYGRSMIVDPWGTVLACVADGTGIGLAEIDPERLSQTRSRLPVLAKRCIGTSGTAGARTISPFD